MNKSRGLYNKMNNCYIYLVSEKDLGKWLENKYLQWQLEFGRNTITSFAEHLGIAQPYLTQLMNGRRKGISKATALMISERLNDYTLLDLLGYARPEEKEITYDQLPEYLGKAFTAALQESQKQIQERHLNPNTPEGEQLIIQIFSDHGFSYTPPPGNKTSKKTASPQQK